MDSSPGTNQGHTPKKGPKKKGDEKPIPEMKLTVDVQQWLRKENGRAVKVNITDLKIDKTKEREQLRQIDQYDIARKVVGYQGLRPPGLLRVPAWEDSGMTRFAFDQRRFCPLLWYMICVADGSLYVLNGQRLTETCRAIQQMPLAEGKELEDLQECCYVDILKYKEPWRIRAKVAGLQQAAASLWCGFRCPRRWTTCCCTMTTRSGKSKHRISNGLTLLLSRLPSTLRFVHTSRWSNQGT